MKLTGNDAHKHSFRGCYDRHFVQGAMTTGSYKPFHVHANEFRCLLALVPSLQRRVELQCNHELRNVKLHVGMCGNELEGERPSHICQFRDHFLARVQSRVVGIRARNLTRKPLRRR